MTEELIYIKNLLLDAGKYICDNFTIDTSVENSDLVSTIDGQVEEYFISQITKAYPDYDITTNSYNSDIGITKNCFVMDTLDGTVNFAHGMPMWVMQVAMVQDGKICASGIYAPKLNELYLADSTGAYLNDNPIHVSQVRFADSVFSIESKRHYPVINEVLKYTRHVRIPGSVGVDFAFLSAGRIGAMLYRYDYIWDYLPGLYLVQQAGGYTIDEPGLHIGASTKEIAELIKECCLVVDSKHIDY